MAKEKVRYVARSASPAGKVLDRYSDSVAKEREIKGNQSVIFDAPTERRVL
jgi:hypothetical protein